MTPMPRTSSLFTSSLVTSSRRTPPVARFAAAALACTAALLSAGPAVASGGGGGGGGGTTTTTNDAGTTSGSTPCVQINSLSPAADQSVVSTGAWLSAAYTVSRCGGNNASFTLALSADDAAGNRVLSTSDTWSPVKSLPFSSARSTEDAAFATAYRVTLKVIVPETGAVVASATRSISTPDARIATCATVTNLGGTAGYYPGLTTQGALWLSYTVKNCGGRDWLDTDFDVINSDTGALVRSYPASSMLAANSTTGVGLIDVEPVPTGTNYEVRVRVHHHGDDTSLDNRSIALVTPAAR